MDSRHHRELPEDIHLPEPSYQPLLLAFGILLLASGVIWTPVLSAFGLLLVLLAIVAWTQENRLASQHQEETSHD